MRKMLSATLLMCMVVLLSTLSMSAVSAKPKGALRYEVSGYGTDYGWFGTIDSGDLEGYTGIWVTLEVDFKEDCVYFYEEWFIGDGIEYVNGEVIGGVVLAGFDEGVTRFENGKFTGNGRVTVASEDYTHLIGRKEHLSGTVYDWGPPPLFTGTMQIN